MTHAKYHYFIRWVHNNQSYVKRGPMGDVIANNDSRNFDGSVRELQIPHNLCLIL